MSIEAPRPREKKHNRVQPFINLAMTIGILGAAGGCADLTFQTLQEEISKQPIQQAINHQDRDSSRHPSRTDIDVGLLGSGVIIFFYASFLNIMNDGEYKFPL